MANPRNSDRRNVHVTRILHERGKSLSGLPGGGGGFWGGVFVGWGNQDHKEERKGPPLRPDRKRPKPL